MASAGDGDRPRLPDTDDPYVLLGIAPDADTKAIRQAYARLIRIYRPDRAPVEFQRIHAAFEEAQHGARPRFDHLRPPGDAPAGRGGQDLRAGEPGGQAPAGEAVATPGAPGPGDAEPARAADIARRLDEACALAERGDHAAAAAAIDALLDERAPLDLLAQRPEHTRLLVRHPSLSWTRLVRASNDADAIRVVWNLAWLDAYARDPDRARALLDDDRLRLDAADDVDLAALCLFRIGGLAWSAVRTLPALLDRYRAAIPLNPALDNLLDTIALDVTAAMRLRGAGSVLTEALLAPLRGLLAAARVGDRESRLHAARAVLAALERDLEVTLRDLDALHDDADLGALFEAIYSHLPIGATRLEQLDKAAFDRLTQALYELGREPHKWKLVGGAVGATVLAGASGGLLPGFALFAGAVGLFAGTERRRYQRSVRPGLARLLLRLPVTTWVVSRWVQINSRLAGRLSRFDVAIDADRALYALSMFATAAIVIGELDGD